MKRICRTHAGIAHVEQPGAEFVTCFNTSIMLGKNFIFGIVTLYALVTTGKLFLANYRALICSHLLVLYRANCYRRKESERGQRYIELLPISCECEKHYLPQNFQAELNLEGRILSDAAGRILASVFKLGREMGPQNQR